MEKLKVGIVGCGFVGSAVCYGFSTARVEKKNIDPKFNTTIDDLAEFDPDVTFVAVPTPMGDDGSINSSW